MGISYVVCGQWATHSVAMKRQMRSSYVNFGRSMCCSRIFSLRPKLTITGAMQGLVVLIPLRGFP